MKQNIYQLIFLAMLISGCSSNPVVFDVKPTKDLKKLKTGQKTEFKIIKDKNLKYLTSPELFNSISVNYKIGETIGFKNDYYLKTMLKTFTTKEGNMTLVSVRSYNSKDTLIDELTLSRTDNDTIFSGKIFEDLTVEKYVNDVKTNYLINSEGKFQIVK